MVQRRKGANIGTRITLAIIAGILGWILFCFGPCRKFGREDLSKFPLVLKDSEKAKVAINVAKREVRYAVRKPDGSTETRVVKEVRRATVVIKDDGEVQIKARSWGFCFEPGLGLGFNAGPRPIGDVQFFYFREWGINPGLYYKDNFRLYLAGSYSLSRLRLGNTSLWMGLDLQKEIIFGVRVRL